MGEDIKDPKNLYSVIVFYSTFLEDNIMIKQTHKLIGDFHEKDI